MRSQPSPNGRNHASRLSISLAIAGIVAPLFLSPCAAQVTDLDIWIDPDFDGLAGPSRGVFYSLFLRDSAAVYIDAHDFVWTNFLCYISFGDSAAPSYISTDTSDVAFRLDISGGVSFPEDNFSFPNVVGFGGFGFPEQSGFQRLGTLYFRGTLPSPLNAASIRPIVRPDENSAFVFCQLGNGESYGSFEEGTVVGVRATVCANDQCPSRVTIEPKEPQLVVGDSLAFTATAHWWDGSTQDFTTVIEWTSSNSTVATIDSFGVARALKEGTTRIRASAYGISGDSTLLVVGEVPPALTSLTVAPAETSLVAGSELQLSARGFYSDDSSADVTASARWSSTDSTIAGVSPTGVVSALRAGSTVIRAEVDSIVGEAFIEVLPIPPPTVQSLEVSPATAQVPRGMTVAFSVSGLYSDGSEQDLTGQVLWASGDPLVATIDASGIATGVQIGTTNVEARLGDISASSAVTVVEELRVTRPMMDDVWFVGALEQIEWTAPGPVDLEWSIDDGLTFAPLQGDVASEEYLLRVPNPPAASARVRARVVLDGLTFLSVSGPFTVEAEIEATSFEAMETADARVQLSWATNPAPPVIAGYRVERALGDGPLTPLHAGVIDSSSFVDDAPAAGATYRLIGVNGWNDESVLATAALETIFLGEREIAVVPNPAPGGETTIFFRDPSAPAARGAAATASIIVIHDVTGRRVRTLSPNAATSTAILQADWDGRNQNGELVAPGHYVVELRSDERRIATSRVTVIR